MGVPRKHKSWSCAAQALLFGVVELQQNRVDVSTAVSGLHSREWVGLALGGVGGEAHQCPPGPSAWHTHLGSRYPLPTQSQVQNLHFYCHVPGLLFLQLSPPPHRQVLPPRKT